MFGGVHLYTYVLGTSNEMLFAVCSRSVGPFGPPKEQKSGAGCNTATLLPLRAVVHLIVLRNPSAPIYVK